LADQMVWLCPSGSQIGASNSINMLALCVKLLLRMAFQATKPPYWAALNAKGSGACV